jgi:phosphohistidine phosphatase
MRRVTLVRHAQAAGTAASGKDFDRPLTQSGVAEARSAAAALLAQPLAPDLLVTSAAVRTVQTATLLQDVAFPGTRLVAEPALYLADAGTLLAYLQALDDDLAHVLVVCHNPGISECCSLLAADGRDASLGTAAWRRFERAVDRWADLR